jgi:hypothetical protein
VTPWVVDANQMDAEDLTAFEQTLLHPNSEISDFLEWDNKSKTIVIAPKGYGKTLLLKAKCKSIRDRIRHIVPSNANLVDIPSGSPFVVSSKKYDSLRDHTDYWHNIWVCAFSIAIFKELGEKFTGLSEAGAVFFNHEDLRSPCDIFARLTALDVGQYYNIREDCLTSLLPRTRAIKTPVAVFVDNLDEYYESTLKHISSGNLSAISGQQLKSYWYLSQLGMASASRELSQINSHLKIYVSIRREILQKAITSSYFGTQLRGKSLIIEYSQTDLEAIIEKNIRSEQASKLHNRALQASRPIEAFFGEVSRVVHPVTGDEERIVDFWLRHTLGRPRDVVFIGERLSAIPPAQRNAHRLRAAIRSTARELVLAYMAEMQPHLDSFDPTLLYKLINKNVLTAADLASISYSYDQNFSAKTGIANGHSNHVFCALFKVGLLGYVTYDAEAKEKIQRFRSPGEESLDGVDILPKASLYLIHPGLDEVIFDVNPDYYRGLDKHNIVGQDRPWREKRAISYILKGDVAGSSAFMRNPDAQKAFEEYLAEIIDDHAGDLDYTKIESGDSLKLVNKNPIKLIYTARTLNRLLRESPFELEIRFGGDAGYITTELNTESNGSKDGIWGEAVLRSARLEPYARAGEVYVTGRFFEEFRKQYRKLNEFTFVKCGPEDMNTLASSSLDCIDGRFNLAKPHEVDASNRTEVFRIV